MEANGSLRYTDALKSSSNGLQSYANALLKAFNGWVWLIKPLNASEVAQSIKWSAIEWLEVFDS